MTSIIAFDLIKSGDLNLDEKFIISEKAWRLSTAGYSSMFVMVGDEVSVEDLLKGIIVASGNDACIALAEGIAGTEEEFAIMMTSKAKEIGMDNTNFANSSGINDPDNYSTVRDIMIMSNYLIKNHPEYYKWFAETEFTWDRTGGDPITQGNRNPLLYKNMGADGIKTGYLAVEKYSLASSIERKGRRLIAVGSGFETKSSRSRESSKLLTYGLTNFDLAEKVGLSPSPCLRRVKSLEQKGLIAGYTAIIDEVSYGYPVTAFVSVRLENQTDQILKSFEKEITSLDAVMDCWLVTGNRDYLLRVVASDLKNYEIFMREELTKVKGIASIETNFALGRVKTKNNLPLNS